MRPPLRARHALVAAALVLSAPRLVGQTAVDGPDAFELVLVELFEVQQHVVRAGSDPQQLVELDVHGLCVAVLRALDQEHHEEGHDGRASVDHQLPGIAPVEDGPGHGPDDDHRERHREGYGVAGGAGRPFGKSCEQRR